jgi:CopG family transcriptional regulator / antitoxin EndoAI
MSKKDTKQSFIKNIVKIKRVNKFRKNNIIEYKENNFDIEFLEMMKEGYKEMSKINLEFSQLPFETDFADINEYENWLCGV